MTDKDSKEVQDWYQKTWSSVPSASSKPELCGTQAPVLLNEPSITPVPFHGKSSENAKDWLSYFQRYVTFKQLQDRSALGLFALLMRDAANTWFLSLSDDVRSDLKETLKSFWDKFEPTPVSRWRRASDMWNRDQRQDESVDACHYDMLRRATEVNAPDEMTRYAIMKGLRPAYRAYVMQQNPKTTEELLEAALVAEATVTDSSSATSSAILDAINRLEQRVTAPFEETRRPALRNSTSPSRFPRSPSPAFHAIVVRSASTTNVANRSTTRVNRFATWNNVSGTNNNHHLNGVRNRVHRQVHLLLVRRQVVGIVVVYMRPTLVLLMVKPVAIVASPIILPSFVAPPLDLNSGAGTKAIARTTR